MKFLLDESADFPLVAYLTAPGHDVTAIARDYPHVMADREVLAIAVREQRVLVTSDNDFGELVFRQQLPHAGVLRFRLGAEDLQTKQQWLASVLAHHAHELSHFVVFSDRGVRVRRIE
jgi:predicted nuclease of predicted toxin-antitoxin system